MDSSEQLLRDQKYRVEEDPRFGMERMRGGDGYDVMAAVEGKDTDDREVFGVKPLPAPEGAHRWRAISAWGKDGWDLGNWPYVVIYWRELDGFEMTYYVEGDLTVYRFATEAERDAATDGLAYWHWRNEERGPDVSAHERAEDLPAEFRGPYSHRRAEA